MLASEGGHIVPSGTLDDLPSDSSNHFNVKLKLRFTRGSDYSEWYHLWWVGLNLYEGGLTFSYPESPGSLKISTSGKGGTFPCR